MGDRLALAVQPPHPRRPPGEENFDGYGLALGNSDFQYGWVENGGQPEDAEYHPGPPYMGDDKTDEGINRFISERSFQPNRPANNRRILEEGTLYIARFEPEGRRKFAVNGDTEPTTATEGTGTWVPVLESELDDTATKLRARFAANAEYDTHFATNRQLDRQRRPRLGPADRRGR